MSVTPATENITVTAQRPTHVRHAVTSPRFQVTLNGTILDMPAEALVTRQNSYEIDTFSVRAAYSDTSTQTQQWFSAQTQQAPLKVAIYISMVGEPFAAPFFQGVVDKFNHAPFGGGCSMSGRSLAAPLLDQQVPQIFFNQPASAVVTQLGQAVGLTVDAASTSGNVGHYYTQDFTTQIMAGQGANRTSWDLLVALAEHESYALYVVDSTLYFQPITATGDGKFPVTISTIAGQAYTMNGILDPRIEADVHLWRPIKVTVQSRHTKTKQTIVGSASAPGSGDLLEFKYNKPRWDTARANAWAAHELTQILQQRATLTFRVPHQTKWLTPRTVIPVSGFGALLDATYYVRRIETRMDMSGCWDSVEACLTNPLTGALAAADEGDDGGDE
jgi:hypothetical protein